MSKLSPSSRNNPCPICENTTGKCRQSASDFDYWQCMNFAGTRKGEITNGYKCLGHTKCQQWAQFRLDNTAEWTDEQRQEWERQVLERVIVEKTQLQLAQETGVRVEEAAVDQAEENFARQNEVSVAELRRRVVAEGSTLAQFREELRQQLLLTRVRDRELASRVTLNDLEVDQFIREQQGLADAPDQEINLAMILVGVPEDATEPRIQTLRERAERLLARARAGEDFGQLAREDSDSRERANGGVLGLRPADRYPQLFVDATKSLRVGAVTDILRSPAGFHILKVLERQAVAAGH